MSGIGDIKKMLTGKREERLANIIEEQFEELSEIKEVITEITLVVKKEKLKQGDTIKVNGDDYLIKSVRDKGANKLKIKLVRLDE